MFHYDHIHLDLARHGRRNATVCRPRIAIPEKPAFYDPSAQGASYAPDQGGYYTKPAPGPQPTSDDSYEQEPDFSAKDFDAAQFDLPAR